MKLKGACPDKRLPRGMLTAGKSAITDGTLHIQLALADFNLARNADIVNEKMPTNAQVPQQSVQIKKPTNANAAKKK